MKAFILAAALTTPLTTLALPDARLTPGAVGPADGAVVTTAQVCARGYARAARHTYDAEWRHYRTAMFREYGIPHDQWHNFTLDHLEPIELAGRPFGVITGRNGRPAWDLRNVWPEPKSQARQKDAVENALHQAVCDPAGYRGIHLTLADAQRARLDAHAGRLTAARGSVGRMTALSKCPAARTAPYNERPNEHH